MSHMVIYLEEPQLSASVKIELQKALGTHPEEIQRAIDAGEPIVELELFDDDYEEHVAMRKRLMKVVKKHELANRIYELPEGETMETCGFVEKCLITPKVLWNILAD